MPIGPAQIPSIGQATLSQASKGRRISQTNGLEREAPESWAVELVLRDEYIIHGPVGQLRANPLACTTLLAMSGSGVLIAMGEYTVPVKPLTGERVVEDENALGCSEAVALRANSIHVRSADRYSIYATDYRAYDVGVRPARPIEE